MTEAGWISLLRTPPTDPRVSTLIEEFGVPRITRFEEDERVYFGFLSQGLCACFNRNRLSSLVFFMRPTTEYVAFSDKIPFGVTNSMSQADVHAKLGIPSDSDEYVSIFDNFRDGIRLHVEYDDGDVIRMVSLMPLEDWI